MHKLEIFRNESFGDVRTTIRNGEPWFCLSDVCRVLTIKNSRDAKKRLNINCVVTTDTPTNGGMQALDFISESNLYKLAFKSRKPEAEKFADWVTSEVLPAIRKTGSYSVGNQINQLSNIDTRLNNMEKLIQDMKNGSVLSAEIQALTKSKSAKTKLPQRVTALENDWYEKNKKMIWKVCEEYGVSHSTIYHSILKKCSEQYDLELAKEIYYQEVGGYPKFMMDLVSYFPELEEIADAFLHSIR